MIRLRLVQVSYDDHEPVSERIERVAEIVGAQRGADVVVLPELWAHGGFASTLWEQRAETQDGPMVTAIASAAKSIGAVVHAGSLIEKVPRDEAGLGLANTSALLDRKGNIAATYRKIHRFGFNSGEAELLSPGKQIVTATLPVGEECPVTFGLATCYDLRFPELFRALLDRGSQVVLLPAAWPEPRIGHWTALGRARAIENQTFMVQCNTAGTHSGLEMGGQSQVVSPTGEVLAQAGAGEEVLEVDIDLGELVSYRRDFPVLADRQLSNS